MEKIFVLICVQITVAGGQQIGIDLVVESDTLAQARQKHASDNVKLAFVGKILDLAQPGEQSKDGSRYWLKYVYKPDGRNDVLVFGEHATLAEALNTLKAARDKEGFKDPLLYRGFPLKLKE